MHDSQNGRHRAVEWRFDGRFLIKHIFFASFPLMLNTPIDTHGLIRREISVLAD